jgi:hypothetical protein
MRTVNGKKKKCSVLLRAAVLEESYWVNLLSKTRGGHAQRRDTCHVHTRGADLFAATCSGCGSCVAQQSVPGGLICLSKNVINSPSIRSACTSSHDEERVRRQRGRLSVSTRCNGCADGCAPLTATAPSDVAMLAANAFLLVYHPFVVRSTSRSISFPS